MWLSTQVSAGVDSVDKQRAEPFRPEMPKKQADQSFDL
jgi:hypothetical protein